MTRTTNTKHIFAKRIAALIFSLSIVSVALACTPKSQSATDTAPQVSCSISVDTFPDSGWPQVGPSAISDELAKACDHRTTGQPCQEDELCAVQQIRDTGDFSR